MSGTDRVMTISGSGGPQFPSYEERAPDTDAQDSSEGEPAARPTVFQESFPESPDSTSVDAQVALARSLVMPCLDADPAVYYHQGSDFVFLDILKNQLAYLPDFSDLRPEANIEDAIVGERGESDPKRKRDFGQSSGSTGRFSWAKDTHFLPQPGASCAT
ncbi:LOW QUALITY PROTEIN: hypothetical protein PHMEG_00019351 [Phytophthora megakarya]|uniref:Uncharacterized protein n=1 Tax=Phytophthora megakarya TaxID=4795 RepID=A0A225VS53_9STRA|nr:LOW QUALITY PROTEIN: hypothetical protein PHMEG_00019351 [Phytophthora megakarya]